MQAIANVFRDAAGKDRVNRGGGEGDDGKADAMAQKLEKSYAKMGQTITQAFKYATASVAGFVTAGLVGTVEGQRLAFAFQRLSQEIAAVFLPTIQKTTDALFKAVQWFRSLSGTQQNYLLILGSTAAGIVLFNKVLMALWANPVIAGLLAVAAAIAYIGKSLVDAKVKGEAFRQTISDLASGKLKKEEKKDAYEAAGIEEKDSLQEKSRKAGERIRELDEAAEKAGIDIEDTTSAGKGFFENPAKARMRREMAQERAALIGIKSAAEQGRDTEEVDEHGKKVPRRTVHNLPGGPEAIGAAYARIQTAVSRTDNPQKQAVEEQKKTNTLMTDIKGVLEGLLKRFANATT
jgi:hypothetical protein